MPATFTIVRNAAGEQFIVSNKVKNSAGVSFDVANTVKRADGNSFLIFADPPLNKNVPTGKVFTATSDRVFIV